MEYASNAKGNLGVTLGAIGTGLGALSGTGLLSGLAGTHANNYVTKEEATMMQQLSSKDSEIALLKADQASEIKMTEVYKQAHSEIKKLRDEVISNRREQDLWNANQSVLNAQMSAAIAVNTNSIASLQNCCNSITQLKIPNTAVCPGWGNITITPSTEAASGTT